MLFLLPRHIQANLYLESHHCAELYVKPDFEKCNGLVPTIVQDAESLEVLMLAYMNEEAWEQTQATGEAHFYSRSRKKLWRKGGTSGHVQKVRSIRLDCDADTILLLVEQVGQAACHQGYRTCFYRAKDGDDWTICAPLIFDPKEVYT